MQKRESNIELLRIVAILMVMALHVNDAALGELTPDIFAADYGKGIFRLVFESLAIAGVDVFVLISGWFGIKASTKGLVRLLFQCAFFFVLLLPIGLLCRHMSAADAMSAMMASRGYWFVCAYIGLYILSPLINMFVEHATKQQFGWVLGLFWTFLIVFGWVIDERQFVHGYSTISFLGLYLLSRYVRLYGLPLTDRKWGFHAAVYAASVVLVAGVAAASLYANIAVVSVISRMWSYLNPLVVIEALALLLLFAEMKIESRTINALATGVFGVFLLHLHPLIFDLYKEVAQAIWANYSDCLLAYCPLILLYITGVYVLGWTIDRVRLGLWAPIDRKWNK